MDQRDFSFFCRNLRLDVLEMLFRSKSSHIGSCFSCIEILATLYLDVLNLEKIRKKTLDRDRFIMSKGHAAAALYALLSSLNFFPKENLYTFCQPGSLLFGHADFRVEGVEYSSGSLGHGVSVGCGLALAEKRESLGYKTFVLISDGELNEGSTWEGIMFAGHHRLSSLCIIIDENKIQSLGASAHILKLEPLKKKMENFGFECIECCGHSREELLHALSFLNLERPKCIIAHTTKGKGVSFMENNLLWHYRHPEGAFFEKAKEELMCAQHAWML